MKTRFVNDTFDTDETITVLDLHIKYYEDSPGGEIFASGVGHLASFNESGFDWAESFDAKIEKLSIDVGLGNFVVERMLISLCDDLQEDVAAELSVPLISHPKHRFYMDS